jgi:hypothetical protein
MSNGDLERMVYNGTMDMATYNWWLNFMEDLGQLAFYLLIPIGAVGGLLLAYWFMVKLLTCKRWQNEKK